LPFDFCSHFMAARRFVVKGRVQGVGFRFFAVQAARRAGVVGSVRNLRDGSVEAIAEGSLGNLAAFRLELATGPTFSRVTSVDEQEIQATNRYTDFDIGY
jgi:acylphosphatase